MFAGEHTGTRRPTDGVGNETVGKTHTIGSNAVDVRSLYICGIVRTQCLIRVVVTHNIEYVHRFFGCLFTTRYERQRRSTCHREAEKLFCLVKNIIHSIVILSLQI